MADIAQSAPERQAPLTWLLEFLREELAPYPGRGALVARMVVASTISMILTMTFRIPFGAYGAIYAITISRESPQATVSAVRTIVIAFACSGLYVLCGALFFLENPALRYLWVIGTLFVVFFALSAMSNFSAASRFGYLIAITIPLWDRHIAAEMQVEDTLWAIGAITLASLITVAIELIFAQLQPWDDLQQSIAERLGCTEQLLAGYAADRPLDEKAKKDVTRLSMLGMSRLRRILQRSSYPQQYAEQMSAVVALVGRLIDLAANLAYLEIHLSGDDRDRVRALAESIATIRTDLLSGRVPPPLALDGEAEGLSAIPLVREMQRTVSLIPEVFAGSQALSVYSPSPSGKDSSWTLFTPDAFSNPEHVRFGLRGCFAAGLCYTIYNAVDWPGISTAITTCVLTALTTIGASRQKQILRIAGALAGGVVLGMGAQIFILPALDTIADFTVLFVAVTTIAAWFATSGPRLSYFGVQIAVAFCLINLQEFRMQTSLAVARDRVAGIMLGLFMMWAVFDQLWAAPAGVVMKRAFVSGLRLLAQFAREPISKDLKAQIERSQALRETINKSFDKVRTLADGVLFEFGSSRRQDLALRSRIVRWQPQLRMVFVTRIALLKYRLNLPGFELPEEMRLSQQEFDAQLAQMLDGMADRIEGKTSSGGNNLEESIEHLEQAAPAYSADRAGEKFTAHMETFLLLSHRIESLVASLDKEI